MNCRSILQLMLRLIPATDLMNIFLHFPYLILFIFLIFFKETCWLLFKLSAKELILYSNPLHFIIFNRMLIPLLKTIKQTHANCHTKLSNVYYFAGTMNHLASSSTGEWLF